MVNAIMEMADKNLQFLIREEEKHYRFPIFASVCSVAEVMHFQASAQTHLPDTQQICL